MQKVLTHLFLLMALFFSCHTFSWPVKCKPGYYPNLTHRECFMCSFGEYCDGNASYPCKDGFASSKRAATQCDKCPSGTATDYWHNFCFPVIHNSPVVNSTELFLTGPSPIKLQAGYSTYVYSNSLRMKDKRTTWIISGSSLEFDVPTMPVTVYAEDSTDDGMNISLKPIAKAKTTALKQGVPEAHFMVLDLDAASISHPAIFYMQLDSASNASKVQLHKDEFTTDLVELKNGTIEATLYMDISSRFFLNVDKSFNFIEIRLSDQYLCNMFASFSNEYPTEGFHEFESKDEFIRITHDQIPEFPSRLYLSLFQFQSETENVKITTVYTQESASRSSKKLSFRK